MMITNWDDLRFPAPWFVITRLTKQEKESKAKEIKQYINQYELNNSMLREYNHIDTYTELFPRPVFYDRVESIAIGHREFKFRAWSTNYYILNMSNLDTSNMIPFFGHRSNPGEITKSVFSQWYKSDFVVDGVRYTSCEQYMMAEKARVFGDNGMWAKIMSTDSPKVIKQYGRQIKGFDSVIWDKVKLHIVRNGNYAKFTQNENLRNFILSTGDAVLVEASPYDRIWGVGISANDSGIYNTKYWRGSNLLGFSLMQVRDEIRRVYRNYDQIDFSVIPEI